MLCYTDVRSKSNQEARRMSNKPQKKSRAVFRNRNYRLLVLANMINRFGDAVDAIDAILPAGTLSGAPKLRAAGLLPPRRPALLLLRRLAPPLAAGRRSVLRPPRLPAAASLPPKRPDSRLPRVGARPSYPRGGPTPLRAPARSIPSAWDRRLLSPPPQAAIVRIRGKL